VIKLRFRQNEAIISRGAMEKVFTEPNTPSYIF
jgi:hypothetical protein